jgi:hypothetical protein
LEKGLKNPETSLSAKEEEQYALYNETREQVLNSYNKSCEIYKYDLRQAASEEVLLSRNHHYILISWLIIS